MNMEDQDITKIITENERESVSSSNLKQMEESIMGFIKKELTKEGLFNDENYCISIALFLLSRSLILEILK